ncbi:TonB family protein [Thiohalophilus sp.]|uniref:TonB family protein n=1 Tax=Thiohalophilus sp. TaxID=3028392 RepID=UPI0028709826|nr:TonB family protein [Thiohalophilus sp.]
MAQLTPAFKLMLIVSIGLHLVAIIESGYLSSGHHQKNVNTRLNITLSQPDESRTQVNPMPEKIVQKKMKPKPNAQNEPKPEPEAKTERIERRQEKPVKPRKKVLPQQEEQQRKEMGGNRSGIQQKESYHNQLLRHLEQFRHYPFMARRHQLEGRVLIRITLTAAGQLRNIECLEGNKIFCEAAIRAAREAQPFPPPPTSLSDKAFEYAMEYKLR